MKRNLLTVIAVLLITIIANGQNLFLIGEKSYPCSDAIKLKSNSQRSDLDVYLANDGKSGLFAVNTWSFSNEKFTGKLIIYLEDGNVNICNEIQATEKVDNCTKAIYILTSDQLNKLKSSNIHTVKYTLYRNEPVNYSASNKGIETREIISEFFSPEENKSTSTEPATNPIEPALSEDIDDVKPFAYVEQMPTFPGGTEMMYKYIYDKMQYPELAKENNISGQVIVQFIVSSNGAITNPKVVRGIGGGCNEEALRIVNAMPQWIPGKHNGKSVAVEFTLPIKFVHE